MLSAARFQGIAATAILILPLREITEEDSRAGGELDKVLGIKNILKSTTALKRSSKARPPPPMSGPLSSYFLKELRMKKLYQGTALKNLSPAIQKKSKQDALLDLTRLNEKMRERLITSCCDSYLSSLRSRHGQHGLMPLSLTVTMKMVLRRIAV